MNRRIKIQKKNRLETINLHEIREYSIPNSEDIWTFLTIRNKEAKFIEEYMSLVEGVTNIEDPEIPITLQKKPKNVNTFQELLDEINLQLIKDRNAIQNDDQYDLYYFFDNQELTNALSITACFYPKKPSSLGSIYYGMIVRKYKSGYLVWGFDENT